MNWWQIILSVLGGIVGLVILLVVIMAIVEKVKTPKLKQIRKHESKGDTTALMGIAMRDFDPAYEFWVGRHSLSKQLAAVKALFRIARDQSVASFLKAVESEDKWARMSAGFALVVNTETRPQGIQVVVKEYADHPDKVMDWLKTFQEDKEDNIRVAALESLEALVKAHPDLEDLWLLESALEDDSSKVCLAAMRLIENNPQYQKEYLVYGLIKLLKNQGKKISQAGDDGFEVCLAALRLIKNHPPFQNELLVDTLVSLQKVPIMEISQAAEDAMRAIDRQARCIICSREEGKMIPFTYILQTLERIETLNLSTTPYYEPHFSPNQKSLNHFYICMDCYYKNTRRLENMLADYKKVIEGLLLEMLAPVKVRGYPMQRYKIIEMKKPRQIYK